MVGIVQRDVLRQVGDGGAAPFYTVPVVNYHVEHAVPTTRSELSLLSTTIDALMHLDRVANDMFEKIGRRIGEEKAQIQDIQNRTTIAKVIDLFVFCFILLFTTHRFYFPSELNRTVWKGSLAEAKQPRYSHLPNCPLRIWLHKNRPCFSSTISVVRIPHHLHRLFVHLLNSGHIRSQLSNGTHLGPQWIQISVSKIVE